MSIPVHRLSKQELIWLSKHKCKEHSHSFIDHYNCYLKENPHQEKLGFLDIETTNLKADFGIVLCYVIADDKSNKVYAKSITKHELSTCLDRKVIEQCIKDMSQFDRVCGYYSSKFDIPFLRTRALSLGIDFPEIDTILHTDLYYAVKHKLCLSSNRLANACTTLFGKTEKTRIDSEHWIKALMGDNDSLDYIFDHCVRDVQELKKLYHKLEYYRRKTNTSI